MNTQQAGTPQPYDGYVTEKAEGYEVAAAGVVVGQAEDLEQAKTILDEHCTDKPRWYVTARGSYTTLDDE